MRLSIGRNGSGGVGIRDQRKERVPPPPRSLHWHDLLYGSTDQCGLHALSRGVHLIGVALVRDGTRIATPRSGFPANETPSCDADNGPLSCFGLRHEKRPVGPPVGLVPCSSIGRAERLLTARFEVRVLAGEPLFDGSGKTLPDWFTENAGCESARRLACIACFSTSCHDRWRSLGVTFPPARLADPAVVESHVPELSCSPPRFGCLVSATFRNGPRSCRRSVAVSAVLGRIGR